MAKRKRSEHYVNNKEFLAALIRYQEDIEIAKIRDQPKISRKMGYIATVNDAKDILEKLYKSNPHKESSS